MGNVLEAFNCSEALVNRCLDCVAGKWVYVSELEENIECLETLAGELGCLKNDVMRRINIAERQGMKRLDKVELWLKRVDIRIDKIGRLLEDRQHQTAKLCIGGCCSTNCISSYKFGKKVVERLNQANNLVNQEKEFEEIATLALPEPLVEIPCDPTVGLEHRLDVILCYLLEENVDIVGLYGETGVGKTALLKQVNNKICSEARHFDLVIWVDASKGCKLEDIQIHIGKKIGFSGEEWMKKSLRDKTADISQVLKGISFVLLLDDIWEQINLKEIGVPLRMSNRCKVVFTTSSEKICRQMRAKKIIKVEPLSPEESWRLFSDIIDEDILNANREIYCIAEELVRNCGGIPHNLVKIALDMACKRTTQEWTAALKSLRSTMLCPQEEIIESLIAVEEDDVDEKYATSMGAILGETNVIGSPITDKTLEGMPQYVAGTWLSAKHRAGAALNLKTEVGKDVKAREYVRRLKIKHGDGNATIGLFYNATGGTLKFSGHKDWHGHLSKGLYPMKVENGQWGVFVHMHEFTLSGGCASSGFIVYSGENASGEERDWLLAWDNPLVGDPAHFKVFTEVRPKDHFFYPTHLPILLQILSLSGQQCQDTWGHCVSSVAFEQDKYGSFFKATLTLVSLEEEDVKCAAITGGNLGEPNVFGSPITDKTLEERPQYVAGTWLSAKHRAVAAINLKTEDGKDGKAHEYAKHLKLKMKFRDGVATIGLFYNATGGTLLFSGHKDWSGHLSKGLYPWLYPVKVENGQWGVFVHMPISARGDSSGFIVYSGENASGELCDWLLAWDNPAIGNQAPSKVFTEVRPRNHFYIPAHLPILLQLLSQSRQQHHDTWGNCASSIAIKEDINGPFFEATLALD